MTLIELVCARCEQTVRRGRCRCSEGPADWVPRESYMHLMNVYTKALKELYSSEATRQLVVADLRQLLTWTRGEQHVAVESALDDLIARELGRPRPSSLQAQETVPSTSTQEPAALSTGQK
jgi:hypothetical protein